MAVDRAASRIGSAIYVFFLGGAVLWGLIDSVRVAATSGPFFFGALDRLSYVIVSSLAYGLMWAPAGVLVGILLALVPALLVPAKHRTGRGTDGSAPPAPWVSLAAFLSLSGGALLFLVSNLLSAKLRVLPVHLFGVSISLALAVALFVVLTRSVLAWRLRAVADRIGRAFTVKRVALTILPALILAAAFTFYDSRLLSNEPRPSGPPNVVLISLDTLSAHHVGCYGYDRNTTPSLDRLAAGGARFASHFVASRWTLPSHVTMLTSLYPSAHWVRASEQALSPEWLTLAEVLRERGYACGAFVDGARQSHIGAEHGLDQGFDFYEHFADRFNRPERLSLLPRVVHLCQRIVGAQGYDMHAETISKTAAAWLKHYDREEPFFLFLHYYDIHSDAIVLPYEAPAPFLSDAALIDRASKGRFRGGDMRELSDLIRTDELKAADFTQQELEDLIALYDAGIAYTDHHVGWLLDSIERSHHSGQTIVVVTADHGEEFLQHSQLGHLQFYDEVLRAPLIVRFRPEIPPGVVVESPVREVDIAPTILDLVGVPRPKQFQGTSLLPLVEGGGGINALPCYGGDDDRAFSTSSKYIILGGRKLIVNGEARARWAFNGSETELYDLGADPGEHSDLSLEDSAEAERLRLKLDAWEAWCHQLGSQVTGSDELELDDGTREQLRALGYVD